ncbi:MAG: hypothetical protein AAB116_24415 [Candidatus Poribacteria bacterium]
MKDQTILDDWFKNNILMGKERSIYAIMALPKNKLDQIWRKNYVTTTIDKRRNKKSY